METQVIPRRTAGRAYTSERVRVVSLLGPVTVVAGAIWAISQPYRLTLLHPHHQSFWWLVLEPPLLVALAGVVFAVIVARPLIADLERAHAAP